MNNADHRGRPWMSIGAGCLLVLLLAGCVSSRIDWDSRIGNFTYDQAILELGPPDKTATLNDGRIVAEWMTDRSFYPGYATSYGSPFSRRYQGSFAYNYYPSQMVEWFTRLVFDPDQKLMEYRQISK